MLSNTCWSRVLQVTFTLLSLALAAAQLHAALPMNERWG
jgi:hypothetical protein